MNDKGSQRRKRLSLIAIIIVALVLLLALAVVVLSSGSANSTSATTSSTSVTTSSTSCEDPCIWIGSQFEATIAPGMAYSVSVPTHVNVSITILAGGIISYPTLSCEGANCQYANCGDGQSCQSNSVIFAQSQICISGATFCPSGDEWGEISFSKAGTYQFTMAFQTAPGGPMVSDSVTITAK